jgi:hypothetical protein
MCGHAWAPRGWVKGTRALSTGKMQAQSSRWGQKESRHSRGMTFRRATGRYTCWELDITGRQLDSAVEV